MDELSEYEKIPLNFNSIINNEKAAKFLNNLRWVATEKLHSANFSFIYKDKKLRFAKRKEHLCWADDFFGFQSFVSKNESKIVALVEKLENDFKAEKIILYGELIGGIYPHHEVQKDENVRAIQTGIHYSPTIEFCTFDIAIDTSSTGKKYYLDYYTSLKYLKGFELLYAEVVSSGKLNDVLNCDIRINSFIPAQLGLPKLETNIIEGIVIKPLNFFPNEVITSRPIIKVKNPEFQETDIFHQAEKWSYKATSISNSEDLDFIMHEVRGYITSNRLNNVLSKIGHVDFRNLGLKKEVEGYFVNDVLQSFDEDHRNILGELNDEQIKWLTTRITSAAASLFNSLYK